MSKIVNHPRRAHVDELLADSLVLAKEGLMPIERRDLTSEDLGDPAVWVIDTGLQYDPSKHNFGHHQLEHAANMSSFRLVARYYNLDDIMMEYYPWYLNYAILDCQGLEAIANLNNTTTDTLHKINSPFSGFLLQMFERDPNKVSSILFEFGWLMLGELARYEAARVGLEEKAELIDLGYNINGFLYPAFIPEPEFGISQYIRRYLPFVSFSVVRDFPNEGWTIFRFNDFKKLDFSKLGDNPLVLYAHEKGFLAKTKTLLNQKQLKDLLQYAVV